MTTFQIAGVFSAAYLRASTPVTAINGFRKTGLWPLDRDVYSRTVTSLHQNPPTLRYLDWRMARVSEKVKEKTNTTVLTLTKRTQIKQQQT